MDDIILVNSSKDKAIGEALDIANTIPAGSSITVRGTNDFELTRDSEVIIITASKGKITYSRDDLLLENVLLAKEIGQKIRKFNDDAKIVIVTNPLDVITYIILKETGFPRENVIGMGSSLDSSRLRYLIAASLKTNQSKVEGIVMGEHGDSMVPIFSTSKVENKPVVDLLGQNKTAQITKDLKNYWKNLKTLKKASVFGAAKCAFDITTAILHDDKLKIPASVLLEDEYCLSDVCLGVPITIGKQGMEKMDILELDLFELNSLKESAEIIRKSIKK